MTTLEAAIELDRIGWYKVYDRNRLAMVKERGFFSEKEIKDR